MELTIEDINEINSILKKLNAQSTYGIYQTLHDGGSVSFHLPSTIPDLTLSRSRKPEAIELKVSMIFLDSDGEIKIGLNK